MKELYILFLFCMISDCNKHHIHPIKCPPPLYICSCKFDKSGQPQYADCTNKTLTKIPIFTTPYRKLIFSNNILTHLNKSVFLPIESLPLSELVISNCSVNVISENAFGALKYLSTLDISFNANITLNQLWQSLLTSNITNLDLSGIPLTKSTDLKFPTTLENNLHNLALRSCGINNVQAFKFYEFKSLRHLDLSQNDLGHAQFDLAIFKGIEVLIAIRCNLTQFPVLQHESRMKRLDVSYNYLQNVDLKQSGYFFRSLNELVLDSNPIESLQPDVFVNLTSLHSLSLQNINSQSFVFRGVKSNSLTSLNISGSNFVKKCELKIFENSRHIQILGMSSMNFSDWTNEDLFGMFRPLCKSLKNFYFRNNQLKTIPETALNCFTKLNVLDLSNNFITGWNTNAFENMIPRKIRLSSNKIEILNETSFPENVWANISILDVQNNPFHCTCNMHWFRQWMKGKYYKLGGLYGRSLTCYSPAELNGTHLVDYDPSFEDCFSMDISVAIAIAVCAFCFVMVTCLNCFVKKDTDIEIINNVT